MAANGGTALRNLDKFRNRTKKINTVTPQPNYNIANLPKSQNEMVHFLEKLAQEMAVQKDTESRVQALRKLCDLVYLLVQLHQQNHSWRQRSPTNNEQNSEETLEEDAKDNLDGEQLWSAFLNNAKILRSAINFAVTDDKVAIVAREACETMVTLATLIKDELAEPLAEHLVGSLWKASNSNVSGVSEVAVKALRTFIQYVQHRRLVKAVLSLFTNQPMTLPMSRNLAAEFVGNILIYQKVTDVQPHLEEIEKIIAIGLKDSSSTIKTTYRKNFWLLAKIMPEQVQEWVHKVDTVDWRSVQEARPAEAPSLAFGCSTLQKQGKANDQSQGAVNTAGARKTATRKTTPVKNVDEREGSSGRKGKIERSQPTNTTASKASVRHTSNSGTGAKERMSEPGKTKTNSRIVDKTNTRASRTTVHTVSSSAKRISNDRRKESDNIPQKLSLRRKQEKEQQQKEENAETIEEPKIDENEEVSDVKEDIIEIPKEREVTEPPILLLSEQQISEHALTEVLDKLHTLIDVNTKVQIIQAIESFLDTATKDMEKEKVNIVTNNQNDSCWIKKDEDDEGTVDILHFVPLVVNIIAKYLQDENEKLLVPAMKALTKLFQIFSFQELRQHNRKLEKGYCALEQTLRENSVLLQKIFEKSGDSNGFIASTATTVLEEMELAIPFFPLLLELISQSCLRQCYNRDLSVKVILQALIYIKAAIQKNRKQLNSYFRENAAENSDVASIIELLVKDVGPHAGGKSAELRRAACDVFMELEEVPTVLLEQVAIERDEGKHLHLLQRLGLIASSVNTAQEKLDLETPNFANNHYDKQKDEPQNQNLYGSFPPRKESCEMNSDTSDWPKTKNEEVMKTENDQGTTNLTAKTSKSMKPAIPLEDTFHSQFEALKEKWMRNKEHNDNEGKEESEAIESNRALEQHNEVISASNDLESLQTTQVSDIDTNGEALNTHLTTSSSNLTEEEQVHVNENETQNGETDKVNSTSCMDQATEIDMISQAVDPVNLPNLLSSQLFIKNIAHRLSTINREDEKECSMTLTEIREQLQIEENILGVSEIYDLLIMFLLFSREKISSNETNYLLDMEFLWQMNFRDLWKRSAPADCLEALDLFCWQVDDPSSNLSRFDSFLQGPSKAFEMKMLFQGIEHALKVLEQPWESITASQQEQIERLKPAILNALQRETCLEIKQAAHKCVQETKDRLRDKQESLPFLEWCRKLNLTVA